MKLLVKHLLTFVLLPLAVFLAARQATTPPSTSANQSPQRDPQALVPGAQQPPTPAAQSRQRDPQAVTVLQQSVLAMGGTVPSDSVANGTVKIIAGSSNDEGTIRIMTRGQNQTAEDIQTAGIHYTLIYSHGHADDRRSALPLPLELAVTSQSSSFPLPLLASILSDSEYVLQYVGLENLNAEAVHHLRVWKTFVSNPKLGPLAELSKRELWISSRSSLLLKLSYIRQASRGPGAVGMPIEVTYSDYRDTQGLLYPFGIDTSLNGTQWAAVKITGVIFNSGLTDLDFPVSARRAQ